MFNLIKSKSMKKLALVLVAIFAVMAAPTLSAATPDSSEKSAVI